MNTEDFDRIESHLREMDRLEKQVRQALHQYADSLVVMVGLCQGDAELARVSNREARAFKSLLDRFEDAVFTRMLKRKVVEAARRSAEKAAMRRETHASNDSALVAGIDSSQKQLQDALARFLRG
jgi:hypothetical protein